MVVRTCEMCKHEIDLNENQFGFVFDEKFFVCEQCSNHTSNEDMVKWTKSVMRCSGVGMPIALWLIHENNRDKPLLSKKK